MDSFHFSPASDALTAEDARRALCLWLAARRQNGSFTVPLCDGAWREELRWLALDWDREEEKGEAPDWLSSLSTLEECEPSPWGQWGGRTPVAELRELGVLPEALVNFLALTAWQPPAGSEVESPGEVFSREELLACWSPEQLRREGVRFDFELLRRVNHAWLERADPDRVLELALPYYRRADWLPDQITETQRLWLRDLIQAVLPGLDFLSLLPPRTRLVFAYQPEHYLRVPESRQAMEREGAREVLRAFGSRVLSDSWLSAERYQQILEEVRQETHWRGRNLHQPIRVALTGLPFGPGLDELIPLIERGA
ncbi:MAG: hypothetical protein ACE5HB_09875, partial [Terriglobia bacterium]